MNRFGDIVCGSRLEGLVNGVPVIQEGDHQDGHLGPPPQLSYLLTTAKTIHFRHHGIEE
jgi:hypothetical protein